MRKVKLLVGRVGDGFAQIPGDVVSVPDNEAKNLIAAQAAEPVEPPASTKSTKSTKSTRTRRRESAMLKGAEGRTNPKEE